MDKLMNHEVFMNAMRIHGEHPFIVETNVGYMVSIVGALQLALRHPEFPAHPPTADRAIRRRHHRPGTDDLPCAR
jgi:hypothetical protein